MDRVKTLGDLWRKLPVEDLKTFVQLVSLPHGVYVFYMDWYLANASSDLPLFRCFWHIYAETNHINMDCYLKYHIK